MAYSDYAIFVDESGDHSLTSIDHDYPIFVLEFCILRTDHYIQDILPKVHAFKFEHFGHDLVVLHEHEIRKQKRPFGFLKNQQRRQGFFDGLNQLIQDADFTIIATVIQKHRLAQTYRYPANPYELALQFCMERAYGLLEAEEQHKAKTHLIVEKRGKREDDQLELAFRRIRDGENYRELAMPGFEIFFADKRSNSAGLQLADLTVRPIGAHVLNRTQPNRAWDIIQTKLYSRNGRTDGWGLKVFPS